MSGHAGPAAAGPPPENAPDTATPPEEAALGLDRRQERYWLIERRCKDLCLYLDVLTRNMPRYEKYVLSAKMREIGYLCLEHVSNIFWRDAPQHRVAVHDWLLRHSPRYRMCSASHR
jgi:hypothetical protein